MSTILKPATIRKVEKFLTEWHELDAKADQLEALSEKLPDGAKFRKARKELAKTIGRQGVIRGIIIRSIFKREEK